MPIHYTDPITRLKGVGQATEDKLTELGIETIEQLIYTFPQRHDDFTLSDLERAEHGQKITVEGRIESPATVFFTSRGRSRLQFHLKVGPHLIKVVFFNQHYLKDRLTAGEIVTVNGKWDRGRQTITAQKHFQGPQTDEEQMEPVYRLKGKMHQKTFRKLIRQGLDATKGQLADPLPEVIRLQEELLSIDEALEQLHFPTSPEENERARHRLKYEEFFLFQLKMMAMKQKRKKPGTGTVIAYDNDRLKEMIQSLPFEMTNAQKRVVNEICRDLKSDIQMNRLLQGDVGSGKTAVAAVAMFAAITAGKQCAFMAPTEILAEQHAETLADWLEPFGIRVGFLAGSTRVKARRELLEHLATGELHVLIGTHALIQPDVVFHDLGLVITDEQHRFGVEQRRLLKEKGETPDVLFMTATPIPRTLAVTTFGEMDVSIIDELPAGRKKIETYWMKEDALLPLLKRMEVELDQGRQAYVICPLIEESDKLDVQNAVDVHQQLEQYYAERYSVGLMHGRLHSDQKDAVMREFAEGRVHVLVSTTVVEVGVNVPNATFMIIYDATRFGLSQLHQLRGRIGRGEHQSYCILLADPKNEEGRERMQSMVATTDGFLLAEKDLQLRGSGDLFGTKQSGMPDFHFGDPVNDFVLMQQVQQRATQLLENPAFWEEERYAPLRTYLHESNVLSGERID